MPVPAHNHKIRAGVHRVREERIRNIEVTVGNASDFYFESVTGEMLTYVCTLNFVPFTSFIRDDYYLNVFCALKKRHGVGNGACSRSASVPTNHDAVELNRRFLDIRHDNHR